MNEENRLNAIGELTQLRDDGSTNSALLERVNQLSAHVAFLHGAYEGLKHRLATLEAGAPSAVDEGTVEGSTGADVAPEGGNGGDEVPNEER